MSRAPSPGMPNDIGMADHFRAIADRFQLFENSPAFTDPNITTKVNKLDDFTNAISNLQETLTQSLRQAVSDEMKSVKDDLESVKEELKSTKGDLTTKIDTVKDDLTTKIDTVKEDLTTKIDALETSLKINIATR